MLSSKWAASQAWWGRCSEGQRATLAFLLVAALALLVQVEHRIESFPHDAALYWQLAMDPALVSPTLFIRGYFYPLVMGSVVKALGWLGVEPIAGFRVFSAITCAAVLTWVLPATYRLLYQGSASFLRRVALAVLLTAMYPGILLFPLSELPSLGLIWLSVYSLLRARLHRQEGLKRLAGWLLLSGCAAAAAYNTRTIYLFSLPLIVAALWLQFAGRRVHLAWFAAGAILVSLPQVAINHRVHGVASANPTVIFSGQSLFALQLWLGVRVQKYETYLSSTASTFQYADLAGQNLLTTLQKEGPTNTVADYLRAVLRHPLEFAGLYGRHLLNGIDVRDGRMYLLRPTTGRLGTSFLCMSALLVALYSIHTRRRPAAADGAAPAERWRWLLPAALMLPGLLAVPGQMETRFMIPFLAYLYTAALAHASWPGMQARLRARWHIDLVLALVAYAVFFAVTQSAIAQMKPSL